MRLAFARSLSLTLSPILTGKALNTVPALTRCKPSTRMSFTLNDAACARALQQNNMALNTVNFMINQTYCYLLIGLLTKKPDYFLNFRILFYRLYAQNMCYRRLTSLNNAMSITINNMDIPNFMPINCTFSDTAEPLIASTT